MPVWRLVTWNDYRHIFFSHWQVTQAPATPTSTLDEDGEVQSQTTPRASTSLATEEFSARSWQQTSTRLERKRNPRPTHAFDYNKDPQKDMNDNLQSIYQYLWTKEIEREQRLKRFSPQDIY